MVTALVVIAIVAVLLVLLVIGGGAFSKEQLRHDSDIDYEQWWSKDLREWVESWRAGRS